MQARQVATQFGRVLREARVARGLSQEELALACDIDRTYVSLLERGRRQPTVLMLFRLSEPLGVRPSSLVAQLERANRK